MGTVYTTPTSIQGGGMYADVQLVSPDNIIVFSLLLIFLSTFVASEFTNLHVPYSKFAKDEAIDSLPLGFLRSVFRAKMDNRLGFFILYFMPLVTYFILWIIFAVQNMAALGEVAPSPTYSIMLLVGWCLSFSKRCLEVLFVHVYSSNIPVLSTVLIAFGYSTAGLASLFFSNQVVGYQAFGPNTVVKDSFCVVFFVIGITVNAIAHLQLRFARTRKTSPEGSPEQEKKYSSPAELGVLFSTFICPHYVFEILMFAAWSIFGATSVHYMVGITIFLYLSARTRATYKWYVKKGLISTGKTQEKHGLLSLGSNSPV